MVETWYLAQILAERPNSTSPKPRASMRISVVTVSYNAANTLADTLESVAHQKHLDVEHLLIDGDSTDATKDVVRCHGQRISRFVSEPDAGLYDAMNKGAAMASGEVLAFLNADDWYAGSDVLSVVAPLFDEGADVVYGDINIVEASAPFGIRRRWHDRNHSPSEFFDRGWQPAHPATFVRTELFKRLGGFDLRWRISADYAFLAQLMMCRELRLRHVGRTLVNMRAGGMSTSGPKAIWRANRECASALKELGTATPWWTVTQKVVRKVAQVTPSFDALSSPPVWRPWQAR